MITFPSRIGRFALALTVGCGLGPGALLTRVSAQAPTYTPAPFAPPTTLQPEITPSSNAAAAPAPALDPSMKAELAHTDGEHHLAPHGTFFLLSYVSVKTDKGVQGFEPGQEVHLVEVHPATHTLVVTDGTTPVEVPPSKLTHDLDIAAMVRQKDAANQARVAAYMQQQQENYARYEREAADATAKDIQERKDEQKEQLADARQDAQDKLDHPNALSTPAADINTTNNNVVPNVYGAGYYNNGGYGDGSPYAYFVNTAPAQPSAPAKAPAAPAATGPGAVAAPAAPRAPGRAK